MSSAQIFRHDAEDSLAYLNICVTGMKNIETKWLYDFLTLEACRHFSQAAEERNISQPAFSRRIKALESAVGVLLFDRTTSPLQLTAPFYPH